MKLIRICALTALFGLLPAAMAQSLTLNPPQSQDLRASALVEAPSLPLANTRRETVQFSYAVEATHTNARSAPEVVRSRAFEMWVTAEQLAQGVTVNTDGPGAVVRVSTRSADAALGLDTLAITTANGRDMTARAASDQLVNSDDLHAAGLGGDARTLGFRLASELGAGAFEIRSDARMRPKARVLISVLDRNSDTTLSLKPQAHQVLAGGLAATHVAFEGGAVKALPARITGYAVSPDGARHKVAFDALDDAFMARVVTSGRASGLWELHVQALTGEGVTRDAKAVFAVTMPVARLVDSLTLAASDQTLDVTLGLQAASAGRYEMSGTLMATDRQGQLRPAMMGAAATWLAAGSGTLTLSFDAQQLKSHGLGAPFALHDVMLRDQSRLSVLETRRNAADFR